MHIDTTFDFNAEISADTDADTWSPTLHEYHQALWTKPLPSGDQLTLTGAGMPGTYHFVATTPTLEIVLTSDDITDRLRTSPAAQALPEALRPPWQGVYTIAGALVFPGLRRKGKPSIDQARGTHPKIADRIDLTLECIRRHYLGGSSPLTGVLERYADFFELFTDFQGYVEFFLLDDLLDGDTIRWFHEFDDFSTPALPESPDAYLAYLARRQEFIDARSTRIGALNA